MAIPVLKTQRLTLRAFNLADAPRVQSLYGAWEVLRMLLGSPFPYPEGAAEKWIATHDELKAKGISCLALEMDRQCIGCLRLSVRDAETADIGYWLGLPYWGQGFASEAVSEIVRFAFADLRRERITACHHSDNLASARILDRLAFVETGRAPRFSLSRECDIESVSRELTLQKWSATTAAAQRDERLGP